MDGQQPPFPPPPERPLVQGAGSFPPPPTTLTLGPGLRPLALRPMGVGELLDAAIRLYRAQWKPLMAIVAIVLVPLEFLRAFLVRELGGPFTAPDPTLLRSEVESALITSSILGVIEFLVIQPFLMAAIAKASTDVYLGHSATVGPTFRFAVARIHSILWILILYVLAVIACFVPAVLLGLAVGDPAFLVIVAIPAIVAVVVVFVRLSFGPTVFVVEGFKGTKALGRSWRLSRRAFWRIFGTLVLTSIMSLVVQGIVALPAGWVYSAIGPRAWPIYAIGTSLAAIVTTPFTTLVAVLLYFDQRIRKEGFDLEVMAREMSSSQ